MQDASSLRIEQNLRYFLQNDESLRKLVENIFLAEEESRMHLSIDDVLEFVEEMAELVGGAPVLSKHIVEKIYVEALYMEKSGANRWAQNTETLKTYTSKSNSRMFFSKKRAISNVSGSALDPSFEQTQHNLPEEEGLRMMDKREFIVFLKIYFELLLDTLEERRS